MSQSPDSSRKRLPLGLQWRLFLRSLALQASWNGQRMQNLGLLVTLLPWLRRQPRNLNRDRIFCRNFYEYFNTNPYLANLIIGGLVRLEQDAVDRGHEDPATAKMFRDSLCRAFASIGDQLFWLGLRPSLTMAVCLLGMLGLIWPIVVLVGFFALGQLLMRFQALGRSYTLGLDIVDLIRHPHWHRAISVFKLLGKCLTGIVVGVYLLGVGGAEFVPGKGLLWGGVVLGLGIPLIMRRRLPGEGLLGVAAALALLLSFAI
jgi:mannose/fructose/N-acetylgalactosamine-specific phosphotransferase system component IID